MTVARSNCAGGGFSNGVRGVIAGGYGKSPAYPLAENIDAITIASGGNAIDFGTLLFTTRDYNGAQNLVRGLIAGGYTFPSPATTYYNTIEYITIASTGNATSFGTSANNNNGGSGVNNSTRGVFGIAGVNTMEYITIASLGNVTDFGNLTASQNSAMGTSNNLRGIFCGGYITPAAVSYTHLRAHETKANLVCRLKL